MAKKEQIFIFSDKYLDVVAEYLPFARLGTFGSIKYLAAADNNDTARRLAQAVFSIDGKNAEVDLVDFLAENNYLHLDAFINICLEEKNEA